MGKAGGCWMGGDDSAAGDLVWLIEEGALADHPGPVLLVDTAGLVLAHNIPAAPFVHRLLAGEMPAVTAMVAAVPAGTGSQSFKLSDEDPGSTLDLAVIDRKSVGRERGCQYV